MKVGRYWFASYDPHFVVRMRSLARHVYSVSELNGDVVIYELDYNPVPEKIVVTDFRIALTSSHDKMSWKMVERDFLVIKDKAIIY